MTEQLILRELLTLPESLKAEVLHFVQFLNWKHEQYPHEKPRNQRAAGSMKGEVWMSEDFDDPLELVSSKYLQELKAKIEQHKPQPHRPHYQIIKLKHYQINSR